MRTPERYHHPLLRTRNKEKDKMVYKVQRIFQSRRVIVARRTSRTSSNFHQRTVEGRKSKIVLYNQQGQNVKYNKV